MRRKSKISVEQNARIFFMLLSVFDLTANIKNNFIHQLAVDKYQDEDQEMKVSL
jgi:hypothetical protein